MTNMNRNRAPSASLAGPRWRASALLLVLALLVLSCGEKLPQSAAPLSDFAQLMLAPSNAQIAQGTAQQFTVRGLLAGGRIAELTPQVTWQVTREGGSAQPGSDDGLLQLEEPGRYQVSARYGSHTLNTVITVTAATLKSLSISPTLPKVAKGLAQQFTATALFSDGTTQDVTKLSKWSVKDTVGTAVAVVSTLGVATGKNVGKARVTVSYKATTTVTTSTTLEVTAAKLITLAVSPSNPTIVKGGSLAFTARGTYSDGVVSDLTADADWAVSDLVGSGVATIDGTGGASGEAVGQATVSAAYDGQLTETTLTVTEAALVALAVTPSVATVVRGTTQPFIAIATFADGSTQDVSTVTAWTATDLVGSSVASVDGTGLARANAVGSASIAGAYRGQSATATLTVTRGMLTGLALRPASASIARGLTQQFAVDGTYADGSKQDLSTVAVWNVADLVGTDVAAITATGLTLGKNLGQATLTATYLGKTTAGTLTVTAATLVTLAVTPDSPVMGKGATKQFTATGTLSDGTKQDLTALVSWTATDIAPASGVATVTAGGLATALKEGQSTITAQYLWQTASTILSIRTTGWTAQPSGTTASLDGVWASDASNVWTVGDGGTIRKWNGSTWTAQPSGTTQHLTSVWGADASNVWAVGLSGTILQWNGSSWAAQPSGSPRHLMGVWGSDASNVWAVGHMGTILKWNGSTWAVQASGSPRNLLSVWGSDANNVWAVGDNGTILKWNGSAWAAQSSGLLQTLNGVGGSSASSAWAVSAGGVILKWNGGVWALQFSGGPILYGVGGNDPSNMWAVGDSGTILKWNGSTWTPQPSGSTAILVGAWGSGASNVWAVGVDGTTLQYRP